ncbi:unnamed protein product [Lactuca saligna]|uniref:Uncharacterized protein n=1 Tax=Lactuca saligna TaxID=75948 RepID=A0AA36EIH9_LACSI|nr:unnamed protein product [Lactuca saligna]
MFITYPVQNKSTSIESGSMDQNIQSTFTKTSLVIQEISSPFSKHIPIDQDFQSPFVEAKVIPSEGAQASRSSFETPELGISKVNLGDLTALFIDSKQCLFQKFGEEFQPLSVEGENITASSSGPVNQTSQSSSERAAKHALDANLDTFSSLGPLSAEERREKKIRVEQLKGKMLLMKNSYQDAMNDHLEMFFRETGKKFIE